MKISAKFFSQESIKNEIKIYSIDLKKNREKYENTAHLISYIYEVQKKYNLEFQESFENVFIFFTNLHEISENDTNILNIKNQINSGVTKRVIFYMLDMDWIVENDIQIQIKNKFEKIFKNHLDKITITFTNVNWKFDWGNIKCVYNLGAFPYVINRNIKAFTNYDLKLNREKIFYTTQNRIRPARLFLYDYLIENDLLKHFEYSFFTLQEKELGKNIFTWDDIIGSDEGLRSENKVYEIKKFENETIECGHKDVQLINFEKSLNTYFDVIFETSYNNSKVFPFSEKTFKPILSKKPFILFAGQDCYNALIQMGFKPYKELIDYETYSKIDNTKMRLEFVCDSIKKVCELGIENAKRYFIEQEETIEYNYNKLIELLDKNDKTFINLFGELK